MSFWIILVNYILPLLLSLIGSFFGVLFGSAITIKYFQSKFIQRSTLPTQQKVKGVRK